MNQLNRSAISSFDFELKEKTTNCTFCSKSIAIIGLVHDSESTLPHLLDTLHGLCCFFKHSVFIIYESNSVDKTPSILQKWSENKTKCNNFYSLSITKIILDVLQSDTDASNVNLDRTERYAIYRNYLLQKVRKYSVDYLMMIDFDIISFDALNTLRQVQIGMNELEYSVLCNRGIFGYDAFYYDVFATILNNGSWTRFDYFEQRAELNAIINEHAFVDVISCFNGIAFYKFEAVIETNCSYIQSEKQLSLVYPELIAKYLIKFREIKHNNKAFLCEHIAFNYCLKERGHRIAVSRDALTYYNKESLSVLK